jgi:hypothetical protein
VKASLPAVRAGKEAFTPIREQRRLPDSRVAGVADASNTLKHVDNARFTTVTVTGKPI